MVIVIPEKAHAKRVGYGLPRWPIGPLEMTPLMESFLATGRPEWRRLPGDHVAVEDRNIN
jgi:hypothetical protein